ncbi:DNA replication and repair protein RadC [Lishizhenia tianjinensis]|uniref:DNA replication and repair protein RadC n=1 Tax=Lishizhenia tianjinensis TaxID=477690 RepID=A0A1I6Y6R2_9FLAO|nr:DNA repair protein RadC [Lishizhenia tianjinensis]SFT46255.1 DNA replication and repair protein RadC [Lishizhenia tianjinensis]
MENLTIKHWAEDDRPREKMMLKGRGVLSNAELIAILIGSGSRQKSAVELAQEILTFSHNCLHQLSKLSIEELMRFKGIGEAKAINILAALELGRRRKSDEKVELVQIDSSRVAYDLFAPYLMDLEHEEFYVMALNRSNRVLKIQCVSKGGKNGTIADGKIIFKFLVDQNATGAIFAHNHPSGNLDPSHEDIRMTKRFVEFGKLIDLELIDHIIVAGDSYTSMMDNGMI